MLTLLLTVLLLLLMMMMMRLARASCSSSRCCCCWLLLAACAALLTHSLGPASGAHGTPAPPATSPARVPIWAPSTSTDCQPPP
jgi:hypothetical protein